VGTETHTAALAGFWAQVFEVYPAPTLVVDDDVRILHANRAARTVLGADDSVPLLTRRGGDALHCLHAEGPGGCGKQPTCSDCVVRGAVTEALETGRAARSHGVMGIRSGGQVADLQVLVNASPVEQGGEGLVVLTIEDVTDVAHLASDVDRAERALRETQARLQTVVDGLAEGVIVATLDGELVHWNPAALAMHGYRSIEECRRRLPAFADTFELRDRTGRVLSVDEWPLTRILGGDVVQDLELEVRRLGGSATATWQFRGSLIRDPDGRPLLAALTLNDVTDRRLREAALRESEQQLSLVLEGSNDGFWDLDLAEKRYAFSARCFAILGEKPCPPGNGARWWWGRLHPDDTTAVRGAIDAHLAGQTERIDFTYRLREAEGGWRWVRAVGRTVARDAKGRPLRVAGTLRDLTERTNEQIRLKQSLEENQKLVSEIQAAKGKVKTLSGLLPMCAWCKRIRDDAGYWSRIESYITTNSDARVSHGMCPECFDRVTKEDV
jgi:PAS domain S-box-containing protein